jgi:hypothetical protein
MYGAEQAVSYPASMSQQQPATAVMSPNEQQPAYIPPSLSGQGVQAYMPSNTNPMPGVYVPPPPDIPAWQHAQPAAAQEAKKFTYTKPVVDPSLYAQAYQVEQQPQGQNFQQQQQQQGQYPHQQYSQPPQAQGFVQGQGQHNLPAQNQLPYQQQQQYPQQTHQQQYSGQPQQYNQVPQHQVTQQSASTPIQQSQWQPPQDTNHGYGQQQQWQADHQTQNPAVGQGNDQLPNQGNGLPNTANESNPQSYTVSPITNRHSMSFAPAHVAGSGRTESVSSIALANLHSQRTEDRINSPEPPSFQAPTPPPPRDDKSKFSALGGGGGPSDWEVFGAGDEVDDEDIFMKKSEKNEPAQLDSVELPAHQPSPPSTHGWPSPAQSTAAPLSGERRDTYEPTPPPNTANLAPLTSSQMQQQSFIVNDAVVAPLKTSPKPMQKFQPPSPQRSGFVMGEVLWDQSKQEQSQHDIPPAQLSQTTPSSVTQTPQYSSNPQAQQPPPIVTGPARDGMEWGASQQTPTQAHNTWQPQTSQDHATELKSKDEAFERLRAESEQEKMNLHAQVEQLKSDAKTAAMHAANDQSALDKEIQETRAALEKTKSDADGAAEESSKTLERIKEDIEGKEDTIKEREATIADLRRQLDLERTKELPEPPAPVPADLIPDIDPWYAGSLERYIAMLRSEAGEPQVGDKIKVFKAFLRAESNIRGLEYYDEAPVLSTPNPTASHHPEQPALSRKGSDTSSRPRDLTVIVPQDSPSDDDYEYSPGGRPVLRSLEMPLQESAVSQQPVDTSAHSTAILTPTSSVEDDSNKTPVQSTPGEQLQSQYKAYVPPGGIRNEPAVSNHRQIMSLHNTPAVATPLGAKNHDEIFFGAHQPQGLQNNSRSVSNEEITNVPVPAPLTFTTNRPLSTAPPPKMDPIDTLVKLLPIEATSMEPSHLIVEIRNKSKDVGSNVNVEELTKTWEKSASLTRKKNDDARRKRQEDNEEHNNDLFDSNEISYAEISQLEEDLREHERELKAQEDRDEYKGYVEAVFDKVYDGIQTEIKTLMDLYIEAESLLQTSVSGVRSLEGSDMPTTKDSLSLLKDLHEQIECNHARVHLAVAERDKRYKKTETQPLYAAGNMTKMKAVERHFEAASAQALARAKSDSAQRTTDLVKAAEDVVVAAISTEQADLDRILAALRALPDASAPPDLIARTNTSIARLKSSSEDILSLFHALECDLVAADLAADIAHARAEGADATRIQQIEAEANDAKAKLKEELERRVLVLKQDSEDIARLMEVKRKTGEEGEEQGEVEGEKEKRLRVALEEAKRRNGHV